MTPGAGRTYMPAKVLPPPESARAAGLRYVAGRRPGIARLRRGAGFRYRGADGRAIRDAAVLARIRALAIPPAWREVWICPSAEGHLQATGRDARGRKQYRYHARWREIRDETKYGRMAAFARALPRIRARVRRDLARPGLPLEKALATVVRLLETTFIRVGNDEYARENASFGLTTLRTRQVRVRGARLHFRFRGKSGVEHRIELADRQLAAIVRRLRDLPGEALFCYVDEDGATRTIESDDVNRYLKECAGEEFTSKDFRTWAGTLLAARALRTRRAAGVADTRRELAQAVAEVARKLGNTPAVCRKCYIHPAVLEAFAAGTLASTLGNRSERRGLIALLERHAEREARQARE
ncbi:MAG TPA: DNA topoisomerase IB, partial [Burkholderiales bacterium]|nr:DNA topoisomerase IB [Burkholderiales bacterium]